MRARGAAGTAAGCGPGRAWGPGAAAPACPLGLLVDVLGGTELAGAPRAVLFLQPPVQEVRDRGRATADGSGVVAVDAGLEQRRDERPREHLIGLNRRAVKLAQVVGEFDPLRAAQALGRGGIWQPRDAVRQVRITRESIVLLVAIVGEIREPHFGGEVEPWGAAGAALRKDLDHAGGRLRAVQRRGRRALEHFDPLDRLGVDVVEAGRGAAPAGAAVVAPAAGAIPPHAGDVPDRLRRLGQARGGPEPDAGPPAPPPPR